jgi:hypothetical protein
LTLLADLPAPPRGELSPPPSVTLVQLPLESTWALDLSLIGGEEALYGSGQLGLRSEDSDKTEKWTVFLVANTREKTPGKSIDVAQIVRQGDRLNFAWMTGSGSAGAAVLKNCALGLSVKEKNTNNPVGEKHYLPLRRPLHAPPLLIDSKRDSTQVTLETDATLPDPSRLKLEIIQPLDPLFPPCEVRSVEGEGGLRAEILAKEEKFQNVILCVGMEGRSGKRGRLTVSLAIFHYANGQRTKLFHLQDAEEYLDKEKQKLSVLQKNLKNSTKAADKERLSKQVNELTQGVQFMQQELDVMKKMNRQAVVQYRIYLPLGDCQLEWFSTKAPPREDDH